MEKITHLNKTSLAKARFQIQALLDEKLPEMGLSATCGRITFGAGTFKMQLDCTVDGHNTAAKDMFQTLAPNYGLDPDWYGEVFFSNGKFRIAGINPRAKKFNIEALAVEDGKRWKFTAKTVRDAMNYGGIK